MLIANTTGISEALKKSNVMYFGNYALILTILQLVGVKILHQMAALE